MHCCVAKVSSVRFVWSLLRQSSTASIGSHCECLVWRCEATKVLICKSSDGYGTKFGLWTIIIIWLITNTENLVMALLVQSVWPVPRLPFLAFCGSCWFHIDLFTSGGEHHCRGLPVSSKTLNPQTETVVGWYPGAKKTIYWLIAQLFPTNFYLKNLQLAKVYPPCGKLHISTEVAKEKPSEKTHGQGLRNFPANWILEDEVPPCCQGRHWGHSPGRGMAGEDPRYGVQGALRRRFWSFGSGRCVEHVC